MQNLSQSIPVTITYENRGTSVIRDVLCMRLEFRNNAGAVINMQYKYIGPMTGGFIPANVSGGAVCVNRSGVPTVQNLAPGAVVNLSVRIIMPSLVQSPPVRLTVKVDGGDSMVGGVLQSGKGVLKGNNENNNTVTVDLPTPFKCTDSDNANDAMTFGTATENNNIASTSFSVSDSCTTSTILTESYCVNNRLVTSTVACPTGYGCNAGACAVLPDLTFNTSTGKMPVEIDLSGAGSVKINYYNAGDGNVSFVSSGVKIGWYNVSGGLIEPAVNPVNISSLNGKSFGTASFAFPPNNSLVRNIKVMLDVYNELYESAEYNNFYTASFPCTETDGGLDSSVKGKTAGVGASINDLYGYFYVTEDQCLGNENVWELYCENNRVTATSTRCAGGCMNGACVPGNFTCTEGDAGRDLEHVATTTRTNGNNTWSEAYRDRCYNSNNLFEFYCQGTGITSSTIACPNGCLNGACVATSTLATTTLSLVVQRASSVGPVVFDAQNTVGELKIVGNGNNDSVVEVKSFMFNVSVDYYGLVMSDWRLSFPDTGDSDWIGFYDRGHVGFSPSGGSTLLINPGQTRIVRFNVFLSNGSNTSTPSGMGVLKTVIQSMTTAPVNVSKNSFPVDLGMVSLP